MEAELNTLEQDLNAWILVKREPWMNNLPRTWVFHLKCFTDRLVKKFKVSFYVRGDKQIEETDFFEVWSPVVQ
ncbi:hypothetical protein ACHAW6_004299 [Cyclotella cf. meneghiniana]